MLWKKGKGKKKEERRSPTFVQMGKNKMNDSFFFLFSTRKKRSLRINGIIAFVLLLTPKNLVKVKRKTDEEKTQLNLKKGIG